MKNIPIRSLTGLIFSLLFMFNVSLVVLAVIKNDDLNMAYAILLSCAQFYLYERFNISRIFFESDIVEHPKTVKNRRGQKTNLKYYDINPN
ncbi:hypothetical protein [Mucilaginibacter sp. HD30]